MLKKTVPTDKGSVEKEQLAFRQPARSQPAVLVVENHEEVRDIVGSMVINQGWRVFKVATVEEALKCLEQEDIDAIVSDWELDDGIGAEILACAMSVHVPPIPTVMISSYASPELVAQARAAGAVDMLAKPFRIEDLTDLLARELRMRFVR